MHKIVQYEIRMHVYVQTVHIDSTLIIQVIEVAHLKVANCGQYSKIQKYMYALGPGI